MTHLSQTMLSVCFDTFEGCNSLEGDWLNRQLNRYHPTLQQVEPEQKQNNSIRHLTKLLVDSIESQKQQFEKSPLCDIDQVFSSTTIREFDTRFEGPRGSSKYDG